MPRRGSMNAWSMIDVPKTSMVSGLHVKPRKREGRVHNPVDNMGPSSHAELGMDIVMKRDWSAWVKLANFSQGTRASIEHYLRSVGGNGNAQVERTSTSLSTRADDVQGGLASCSLTPSFTDHGVMCASPEHG
ncbi:unnamed protein product [Cyclocybe aegerita]|uniref:Uncharacterized protein n=1 Tax=Cyclocybe aegerita TaxID=1973307 RepID=A0A8S0WPU1_CYCAE|nr:unnamed protein product [Cyclocybe aegerita]